MSSETRDVGSAPRVLELADRLEVDIRERRLAPGDRYLSAADAARMLRVSVAAANRALQLLTQRGRIERRQRVGSVIAAGAPTRRACSLARVTVIMPDDAAARIRRVVSGVRAGLGHALDGCTIESSTIDPSAVEPMLRDAAKSRDPVGFVLVAQPTGVQRVFAASGLPTVVYGLVQSPIPGLASLDRDHAEAARLLLEHVLTPKCGLLMLMRDRFGPGDQSFLDGALATAAALGLDPTRITLRFLPQARRVIEAILEATHDHTAIVCRDAWTARTVRKCLADTGREAPVGVDADLHRTAAARSIASTRVLGTPREHGAQLARLLVERADAPTAVPTHSHLPVELVPAGT